MKHKYKMIGQKLLLVFIMIMMTGVVFAQTGKVTGTIRDAVDGTTLPGATVKIQGTSTGTISDIDGNFSLEVEPNTTLVVSYVGYETQEILVQPGTSVEVSLSMASTGLDELVVIGYGVQKKSDATGSVVAISTDDFNKGGIATPTSLISGKVAGVQITSSGGDPGGSGTIRIRGGSSLNASNDPLIVVDGIPLSSGAAGGSRSALNSINPNDIETFTVLKDASATAIYGSRASNGVIIITTKKGKEGAGLKLSYEGKLSYYEKPKSIDVLSSEDFIATIKERFPDHVDMLGTWTDPDGNAIPYTMLPEGDREGYNQIMHNTDWQDEIYQGTVGMDHNLTATGSYKTMPYRLSLGYTDQKGTLETSEFKRTTLSASLNPVFFDNHLKVNLNANGAFIKNRFANRGAINAALQMDPTKPVNNTDGAYGGYWAWLQNSGDPVTQATSNPVAQLQLRDDQSNANRIYGNVQLDYKMHFLPELKANLNLGYDKQSNDGDIYVPNFAAWSYDAQNGGGEDNHYKIESKNELLDFYLNYVKDVENLKSRFDLMAGYSWQHFWDKSDTYNSNIPDFDIEGQDYIRDTVNDESELYLVSFFGRFNYSYDDKYLFTATLRNDGTSRFSEDNRWGLFPAFALGWKINEEAFLKNSKTINLLKLRLGWGITGQQDIGGRYDYMGRYTYGNQFAQYPFGTSYYYTLRPEGYNANLKWEETTTFNIGIDFGLMNDRIYGSIEYYNRQTKDLLSWVPVPAGSNLSNYINRNIGELSNKGIEFSINSKIISQEDMFWELGFNATYNDNEITELYQGASIETGGIAGGVGNNIQINAVGQPTYTFYVYEQVYDNNGAPIEGMYVDRNGDGQITSDDRYFYKDANADVYLGVSSNFTYKDWNLYMAGRANLGNYMYYNVLSENGWYNRMYRPEGPYLSNILSDAALTNFDVAQYQSDYYIQNASFFRMDEVTLSYTFRDIVNDKMDLRLSGTVNNAFVITNYDGVDPEIHGGIDNSVYPRSRVWIFGVNLIF